nr:MAG TPA: minor structural protein [Caudoviricetes sp.]
MEWLKKILESATITDGKLDIEALMKQINVEFPKNAVPKDTFNGVNEQLKTANATIKDRDKQIEKLKEVDPEKLQEEITRLQGENKAQAQAADKKYQALVRETGLKEALKAAGVKDVDYLIYKHGGVDQFNFDKDSKVIGLEEILKPYRENQDMAHLFPTGEKKTYYNPVGGKGSSFANPWAKETFNLTEQGKLFKENPAQAKELAASAGINLNI